MREDSPLVSIVVPCFNEEEVIAQTVARLRSLCDGLPDYRWELVFVDDGSRDRTRAMLRDLAAADPRIKVVGFARNFGHQVAATAGIDAARGDAVVLIDADLQDPPEVVPEMVARWREGFDVVYGTRTDREGESAFKLQTARAFYRLLNRLSEVPIPLDTGDFRMMSRRVVDVLRSMPERERFLRGMVSWVGFRQVALPYRRAARAAGQSKYPLRKMVRFAFDGILAFSNRPLGAMLQAGIALASLGAGGVALEILTRLLGRAPTDAWTLIVACTVTLAGVQLLAAGVLGQYVGRIYNAAKGRPLYVVDERIGLDVAGAATRT
jgi:dolichol-phosphate mannosyltransferase